MDATYSKAAKGIIAPINKSLSRGERVYRFASLRHRDGFFSGPWWIGFSPYENLWNYATHRGLKLREVAREFLAVDYDWNDMDVLVSATVAITLAAWSGAPLPQWTKTPLILNSAGDRIGGGRYDRRWEGDRSITQYYIPGLKELVAKTWVMGKTNVLRPGWYPIAKERPSEAKPLWQIAFEAPHEQPLTVLHP
jgi:hypothetical protein